MTHRKAISTALGLTGFLIAAPALLHAQLTTTSCGGNGDGACSVMTSEFWANDSGPCDRGLKSTNNLLAALSGNATCVNDSRSTQSNCRATYNSSTNQYTCSGSWVQWAMLQQRNNISGNVPYNNNLTFGTHNSYNNYSDGDQDPLSTDQYFSITDQLNLGARYIRLDPIEYFGQVRLCHSSPLSGTALTAADLCVAMAGAEYLNDMILLTPFLTQINFLPPPIPEIIDGVAAYEVITSNTKSANINNRLYVNAIREIADWLNNNPNEFINLALNPQDVSDTDLIAAPIATYLGTKVFTGDDFANGTYADPNTFPSIQTLLLSNKQVLIGYSALSYQGTNWTIDNGGGATVYPSEHGPYPSKQNKQFYDCMTSPIKVDPHASIYTGEDRSGGELFDPDYTGLLGANEVALATQCGFSTIAVDYLMSLGSAVGGLGQNGTDFRREATIWSWAPGDYGQAGPATLDIASGHWISTPAYTQGVNYAFACARTDNPTYPKKSWKIALGANNQPYKGNWFQSPICNSLGEGWTLSHPETALDNQELLTVAQAAGITDRVWLDYVVGTPPVTATSPTVADAYMDQGGTTPDPVTVGVAGDAAIPVNNTPEAAFFYPNLNENPNHAFYLLNLGNLGSPTDPITLAQGPQLVLWEADPSVAQNFQAAGSGYTASFAVDVYTASGSGYAFYGYSPVVNGGMSLHVMYPTTTTMCSAPSSVTGGPLCPAIGATNDTLYTLVAQVNETCAPPPVQGGDNVQPTGTVTFTDTYYAPGGEVTTKTLGWAVVNSAADAGGPLGQMQLATVTCPNGSTSPPNNTVCAQVSLSPGKHTIVAHYNRDSSYNASASAPYVLNVAGFTSPESLIFNFSLSLSGAPAAQSQTLTYSPANSSSPTPATATTKISQVTASIIGSGSSYTVTVQPPAAPGSYSGEVDIYLNGVNGNNMLRVPMQVNATGPITATGVFSFESKDQSVPNARYINVGYLGGTVSASSPDAPWLTVAVAAGTGQSNPQVRISANPNGLASGTYKGTVLISQPGNPNAIPVPVTLTETITGAIPSITINTTLETGTGTYAPANLQFICDGNTYTAPFTLLDSSGSAHYCQPVTTVQYPSTGARALFQGWADGYPSLVRQLVATGSETFTLNYRVQYAVTASADPICGGTVQPLRQWFNPQTTAVLNASPNSGYTSSGFTGDITFAGSEPQFAVSGPANVTAHFACVPAQQPAGQTCPTAIQVNPSSLTFTSQTSYKVNVSSANGGPSVPFTVVSQAPAWLEVETSGPATPATMKLTYLSGALQPGSYSTAVVIQPSDGSQQLQFTVSVQVTAVNVASSPAGLEIGVDNVKVTTPAIVYWVAGSSHLLSAPPVIPGATTKLTFSKWSDGDGTSHNVTAPPQTGTYTVIYTPSYLLTLTESPANGGNVVPQPASSDGFYVSGTEVTLTAGPASGYVFTGFSGSQKSTANPLHFAIVAPQTIAAGFAENKSSSLSITTTGMVFNPSTNTFSSTFTVTNKSSAAVAGPISILLTNLASNVTVANQSGTFQGSPFVTLSGVNSLAPGASAQVVVQFADPTDVRITFTAVAYSGSL